MKFIWGLLAGCAFTIVSAVIVVSVIEKRNLEESEARFWKRYDPSQVSAIYSTLDNSAHPRERIIKAERAFIEKYLPENKNEQYMDFFMRGLSASNAPIMIEGDRNQYLSLAFTRGFEMKRIFTDGYRAGLWDNQYENQSQ